MAAETAEAKLRREQEMRSHTEGLLRTAIKQGEINAVQAATHYARLNHCRSVMITAVHYLKAGSAELALAALRRALERLWHEEEK